MFLAASGVAGARLPVPDAPGPSAGTSGVPDPVVAAPLAAGRPIRAPLKPAAPKPASLPGAGAGAGGEWRN